MSDQDLNDNAAADEAALDAEIAASIESVRAGQTTDAAPAATGQTGETAPTGPTGEATPTGETGSTGEAPTGGTSATGTTGEDEIRIPNKGQFESDEAYEKRIELFDLVNKKRAATTPEAKAALSEQIKTAKGELKTLGSTERFIQPKVEGATGPTGGTGEVDPQLKADQERARALGLATKEDIDAVIAQTQQQAQVRSDLEKFVDSHAELKDSDVREVFFDFVENNYLWQGKTGNDLLSTLEMAHNNMFRPAETVTDRVLRAAGVADKVGAMNFPGGTQNTATHSPEMQKSIDELKAVGYSEEKALELLSD